MRVLSIDAWREAEGGWTWNNWFNIGEAPKEVADYKPRKLLKWLRNNIKCNLPPGHLSIEDDGYNIVIKHRHTGEPLYALEYGNEQ